MKYLSEVRDDGFDNVIYTDETTVQLESHRRYSYRKKRECATLKPRPKHPTKLTSGQASASRELCWLLLTLGAHAQEGYSSLSVCLCVSVCLSVPTLGGYSFIYGFKVRYQRLVHDTPQVFNSWISLEVFCLRVMALFI